MTFLVIGSNTNILASPVTTAVAMGRSVLNRFSGAAKPDTPSTFPPLLAVNATTTGRADCREKYMGKVAVCSWANWGRGRALKATTPETKLYSTLPLAFVKLPVCLLELDKGVLPGRLGHPKECHS